jgi:gamma-glutamyltranspeptidase/glutathione hydrolase
LIFNADGDLEMAIGSPGGSAIIAYVSRTIIAALDWNLPLQEAVNVGNVVSQRRPTRIEAQRLPRGIAEGLAARGWSLRESESEDSGLHGLRITPNGIEAAADPRREGVVARIAP